MTFRKSIFSVAIVFAFHISSIAADANRLTYLDEFNPFAPGLNFPKLTTPQWIGEAEVEAVVVVSIDDMSATQKYEDFLRPILERLKKIDGHAPLSIFCNGPNTEDPQLQRWLAEGLSFEIHTLNHPCPCLQKGSFETATNTFHGCVDLLNHVRGNKPVAFRMPCCDSINSPSPRFYAEIFNGATSAKQFLTIDSSVMNITTANDTKLPRELTTDNDGKEKFRKYIPFPSFVTTIENYPYPYQIGKTIWEFPCAVPSDWEGQNIFKTNNHPAVVADWKSAIDAAVLKQGVFTMVFHPHGWIKNQQIVELIDYAVAKYGRKIKFLNFREAQERLNKNLLAGQALRGVDGQKNGIRLLDLNNDGYMDIVIGNDELRQTRIWNPAAKKWNETGFPVQLVKRRNGQCADADARFGVLQTNSFASFIVRDEKFSGAWDFDGAKWIENKSLLNGLEQDGVPILTRRNQTGAGFRLRDIDNDGRCEVIIGNDKQNAVFNWSPEERAWQQLPFALPDDVRVTDATGRDLGLRFVDVNEDGFADIIFSNEEKYSLHLFLNENYVGMPRGWSHKIRSGKRGDKGEIPTLIRGGAFPNNGAWFRNRTLWVQNENTSDKPDLVDRLSFDQMLELEAPPAKSPRESLACIKVRPGFKVELVASEPLIADPIAFDWSADGKLWVLEMGDYPLGMDGEVKGGGRVRFLEDTNADGSCDKSTLFLDGLNIPSGLFPWRKGVLVLAAPDLFYAEDTDGDGKADVKNVLFTGFHPGNPQHRANGFDYGLDNWLYGANGDSGGEITSVLTGKKVNINGRDFRFRPDTGEFESESGQTQYGRHRNDWGDWFGTNNPNWLWHYLFAERYITRNPHLPIKENKKHLANYPDSTRVFAISQEIERFNDPNGAEHVTSGNTPMPYRDGLFGADFATSIFTSEPVHNCVHREVLEQDGVTFKSRRAVGEEKSEFLASTDNWFRPTMTKTGPDGALYIADMYRLVIEHPEWISADRQKRIDLRAGSDKGRIYRVLPENAKLRAIPNLATMSSKELVAAMDSPNGWQRDTAQRLLVQDQNKGAIGALEKLAAKSLNPKARLQALCTLEGLSHLTSAILLNALKDSDRGVREQAVRLSEKMVTDKKILSSLLRLVEDPEVRIRYQLAFSLGEWSGSRPAQALAKVAFKDWQNPQMRIAVMSSAPRHVGGMLSTILAEKNPPASLVEQLLGLATALGDEKIFIEILSRVSKSSEGKYEPWQFGALAGFLDALDRRGQTLVQLHEKAGDDLKRIIEQLENLFAQARLNSQSVAAIRLLGRGMTQRDEDIARLGKLMRPQMPEEIQNSALTSLKKINSPKVADTLLAEWKVVGPNSKTEAIDILFGRPEWMRALLAAIEKEEIPAGQIGTAQQQRLLKHSDEKIKERAGKLFFANADRQKIVKAYEEVAGLKGDAANGHALFLQTCAPCHRVHDEGNQIGPDLGMMADKPVSDFLMAILDPNQAVEARYVNYSAVMASERELSGIIATETPNSITLKNLGGVEETILRSDLKELKSSGLSLMPEGFENSLDQKAMADLISYLSGARPK